MEIPFVKEINLAYLIPHSIFSTMACRKDTFTTMSIRFKVFLIYILCISECSIKSMNMQIRKLIQSSETKVQIKR